MFNQIPMFSQDLIFPESVSLEAQVESLKILLTRKDEKIIQYEEEINRLLEMMREFRRHRFGSRKERWESEEQVCLFNEAEVEAKKLKNQENETNSTVEVRSFQRIRGKRSSLPTDLPRELIVLELPLEERLGKDGTQLRVIGKEVSEKLVYEPAIIKVIEYHRLRYGVDSGDTGKIAPPVPSIIPKGIATPSLLAQIVTSKYADGLPLYRQEEIFGRSGIDLTRGTMARWIIQAAEACQPIWNSLEERLLSSPYVSCDETHTQVLKEAGRAAENKSWMWVRATPSDKSKIILFDYDPHRSGEVAKRLFLDYHGTVQVDRYSAYSILEKQKGITLIGCNMHGRRKFFDAWKTGMKEGFSLAEQGVRYYQRLYLIEKKARGLSPEERFKIRSRDAVPIWTDFKTWADQSHTQVPPQSKIGKAFHYFLGEYPYLIGYLKDGRFEMDNGFAERAIRYFAIGRKNWMFSDSEAGAHASSLFYSLIITAKMNKQNPYDALKCLFTEVPKAQKVEDYEQIAKVFLGKHV
jgi:transposase